MGQPLEAPPGRLHDLAPGAARPPLPPALTASLAPPRSVPAGGDGALDADEMWDSGLPEYMQQGQAETEDDCESWEETLRQGSPRPTSGVAPAASAGPAGSQLWQTIR